MNKKLAAIVFCGTIIHAHAAFPHGAHIKKADIKKGAAEIHNITVYSTDDDEMDSLGNKLELSYGFTNNLKLEISTTAEDHEMEKPDYLSGVGIAAQIGLADEGEYIPQTSVYVSYDMDETHMNEADKFAVMGIFGKKIARFDNTLNVQLAHETGNMAEGGLGLNMAAQSIYEIQHHLGIGLEYFGEFGQADDMQEFDMQGHQLGPVVLFAPFDNAHASVGYLFGLSEHAPDGTAKVELGYEFN